MAYQNAKVAAVMAHEIRNAVTISLIHSQYVTHAFQSARPRRVATLPGKIGKR